MGVRISPEPEGSPPPAVKSTHQRRKIPADCPRLPGGKDVPECKINTKNFVILTELFEKITKNNYKNILVNINFLRLADLTCTV